MGFHYNEDCKSAPDISWLPLGNCSGRLVAVEAPVGLPIITSVRSPCSGPSVVGGTRDLDIDYANAHGTRRGWNPWKICFEDGMQPAVGIVHEDTVEVRWPGQMRPGSRGWIDGSNMLETVCVDDEVELTTVDFIPIDRPVLVRRLAVTNLAARTRHLRLYHYSPINPSGRHLRTYSKKRDYRHIESCNECTPDAQRGFLVFTTDDQAAATWVTGSPTQPSGLLCGNYPESFEAITRGDSGAPTLEGHGVVDGALVFDFPEVDSGESAVVDVLTACCEFRPAEQAANWFESLVEGYDGDSISDRTRSFWSGWAASHTVPGHPQPGLEALIHRLLAVLKACAWDTGGIPCDQGELTDFYFRDSLRPALALSLFGHQKEAERILLALQACASRYGYNNCNGYEPWVADAVHDGVDQETGFKGSQHHSVDDPALVVFTIGRLWEAGHNVGFIEDIWPFLEYSADLAQQDMSPIGAVAQNAGFQDDMVSWAFPRGRDPYGSFPGLTCSYWNMVWTRALELASGIANELGHPGAAENWSRLAGDIRHVIESQFWNGDLRRYAYFHDPEAATCYYGDLRFTAVSDGEIGQFVFPDPPLANGASLLHWCGYSDGPRATRCYELVRDRLLPLPDDLIIGPPFQSTLCDTSSQYHGADQSVSYARLLYAACEVGDTATAETLVDWLAKHIPLAGVPEVFPTGVRAVQLWPCGEMLIAFHHHLSDETSR